VVLIGKCDGLEMPAVARVSGDFQKFLLVVEN